MTNALVVDVSDGVMTLTINRPEKRELAFFADKIPAREAERLGLVNCVLSAAELEDQVKEWTSRLAAGPARALSSKAPETETRNYPTSAWPR